jgi:hypothetical protein
MAQDARLNRKVSLAQTGIALKDLLRQVSGSGVTLDASRQCADQKLQLRLRQRPLRSLMTSQANLLGGVWQPTDDRKGYIFSLTDATMLRRRRWWSLFQGEHDRALTTLSELVLRGMRAPLRKTEYGSGAEDPQVAAADIERMRTDDVARHSFFGQLPPELQERAAHAIATDPYYGPIQADTGWPLDDAIVVALSDLPSVVQETARNLVRKQTNDNAAAIAYVRLRNGGLGMRATFLDARGKSLGETSISAEYTERNPALVLDHRALAEQVRRMGRLASPEWKELAAYQNSVVWKSDSSPDFPPDLFSQSKGEYVHVNSRPIPPRREDVLSWLADRAGLEFVADYYVRPYIPFVPDPGTKRALKAELDYRAAEQDMSWKQQNDSIYLFRNNRWYRDDALEVPNDLLRRWMVAVAKLDRDRPHFAFREAPVSVSYARQVLDLRAEIVGALTPWQILNGLQWTTYRPGTDPALPFDKDGPPTSQHVQMITPQGVVNGVQHPAGEMSPDIQFPFGLLADTIMNSRNTLRFYAALTPEQRAELLNRRLSYASLTQEAQQSAVFLEPLLPIALQRITSPDQPLLLGLTTQIGGGLALAIENQMTSSWQDRTGIAWVHLFISAPSQFVYEDTRSFKPE